MAFGDNINMNANFTTFYLALLTLIRTSTGENWTAVMHDCNAQVGAIAIFYWVVFILITYFIFLNIFIAVIYESFSAVKSSEDANEVLSLKR